MRTITILDIPIRLLPQEKLDEIFDDFVASPGTHHIVTVNPEYIVYAARNPDFKKILREADLATADGAGIILAARLRGYHVTLSDRLTGVMLTDKLLRFTQQKNLRALILLKHNSITDDTVLRQAVTRRYPSLDITVRREPRSLEELNLLRPEVIFVALGSPHQDLWITRHQGLIPSCKIAVGVGGTFDFISGRIKRAPELLRSRGLEWLFRLLREPKRFMRIIRATIIFPYLVLTRR